MSSTKAEGAEAKPIRCPKTLGCYVEESALKLMSVLSASFTSFMYAFLFVLFCQSLFVVNSHRQPDNGYYLGALFEISFTFRARFFVLR